MKSDMKLKRLPDSELEVMMALWGAKEKVQSAFPRSFPRTFLEEKLKNKGWAGNTINTYLSRLLEKGFLSCERRGKTNFYTPLVGEAEYLEFESKTMLNRLYGSSLKNFVASLCRQDALTSAEIDELQRLLDQLKNKSAEERGRERE